MYKVRIENTENGDVIDILECRGYLLCVVNDINDEDADYDLSMQNINIIDIDNIGEVVEDALDEIFPPLNNNCSCEHNCELNCDCDCRLSGK